MNAKMKTKALVLLTCTMLIATGCSASRVSKVVNEAANTIKELEESSSKAPSATPSATPEVKDTKVALGKKGTFGDWKVCVKKASTKKKIKNGKYTFFKPGKGKTFVVISLSARNIGEKEAEFLPRMGYENELVSATLYYKEKYEYKPSELLSYDKDMTTRKIKPLSTEKGIIAFEVPKKVAKSKKNLKLRIGTKGEGIVYSLK